VFSVVLKVTAICVGENSETTARPETAFSPAIAAMAPWIIRPQCLGVLADTIFFTCITAGILSLFDVRAPILAKSFNLQTGATPHNAYYYLLHL
jgi:hypothetical protein